MFVAFSVPEICRELNAMTGPVVRVCDVGPCNGAPLELPLYNDDFYRRMGMDKYRTLILYYERDGNVKYPITNVIVASRMEAHIPNSYMEHSDPVDKLINTCTKRNWPQSWVNSSYINGHLASRFDYDVVVTAAFVDDNKIKNNKMLPEIYDETDFCADVLCAAEIGAMYGKTQNVYILDHVRHFKNREVFDYRKELKYTSHTILDICGDTNYSEWKRITNFAGHADPNYGAAPQYTPQLKRTGEVIHDRKTHYSDVRSNICGKVLFKTSPTVLQWFTKTLFCTNEYLLP